MKFTQIFIFIFLVRGLSCVEESCFLQTANVSLQACVKYLNYLSEIGLPNCKKDNKVCESTLSKSCPTSCAEVQIQGNKKSGVYKLCTKPWFKLQPFEVYCDLETDGGGWTVFQRRGDFGEPADSFYQTWDAYKNGFGNLSTQFWLGNERIFALTNQDHVSLRIDLEDFEDNTRRAEYKEFQIEGEGERYKMIHLRNYSGDAGDSLTFHKGQPFYTKDKDNSMHCARDRRGGWWYANCHQANLNGLYVGNKSNQYNKGRAATFVAWGSFRGYDYSLKRTEMKIRPTYFVNLV